MPDTNTWRDVALAVLLAFVAALVAEQLGADARSVLVVGSVTSFLAYIVLSAVSRKRSAHEAAKRRLAEWQGQFRTEVDVRPDQVVLSLYLPGERWVDGARCEVSRGSTVWQLGEPTLLTTREIHPVRAVWRFPVEPAPPVRGNYVASMFVAQSDDPAGEVEWDR